jgi:hypothetical protein
MKFAEIAKLADASAEQIRDRETLQEDSQLILDARNVVTKQYNGEYLLTVSI